MTQDERSAAIDERRAEMKEVQRKLRAAEKDFERLTARAQILNREIDALLLEYNRVVASAAWGVDEIHL